MADSATNKNSNLTNDLFDAIYTIVTGVVARQNYDITKECKIIEAYLDDKGARTGIYKVKSQDAVYDAYARQGEVYYIDQKVYVQIPNGDFNNQKFIIGLKVNTEDEQDIYNLKLPFDDFVGFYNLTHYTPMQSVGYWANCDYQGISIDQVATGEFPMSEDHVWHWENAEERPIIASKLGIEVDVTTLLHTFRPIAGRYGFRVIVRGQYSENDQTEAHEELVKEYYFTNDDMYGNPYAYTMPSTQQIVFDTTGFKSYNSIDIWFWQDHNFLDELGNKIPWGTQSEEKINELKNYYFGEIQKITENETLDEKAKENQINSLMVEYSDKMSQSAELKNILFNNMHVLLGLSTSELNEETVTIYTYDTTTYGNDPNNAATREKTRTLYAAWVHKVDDTLELIDTYSRIKELDAKVYWYNYDPEWGPGNPNYNINEPSHRLGGNYWKPYPYAEKTENIPISFEVTPDRNKAKERYKCVIYYNNTYVISNVFIFQNFNTSIESDNVNLARNDRIILRCATLQHSRYIVKNDKNEIVGISYEKLTPGKQFKNARGEFELFTESYTIEADKTVNTKDYNSLVADDAIGNFFVYDENNAVLANDNNVLFSDVQYFIEPWIRVDTHIDSDYIETNGSTYVRLTEYTNEDGVKPNFKITWQFPESFTMIRSWGLLDDTARNIGYWNHRSEELFELDKKATRYFYIDAIHNIRYNDNDIVAVIEIEGMGIFNAKKELLFGRAGAFGCEFNPVITISKPAGNFYIHVGTDFEFRCLVYDRTGQLMPEGDRNQCKFTWRYIGTESKPLDNQEHENYGGFVGNVIKGKITNPIPFVVEVTVSKTAAYDITVRRGIMICDDLTFMDKYDVVVPNRVEFNSDGQMPIFASNAFEVQKRITEVTINNQTFSAQNELVYPEWHIENKAVLDLVAREYEYPIFTLPDGSTTADNPNTPKTYTTYGLTFSATKLNEGVAIKSNIAQQWTEILATDEYFTYIYFNYDGAKVAQAIAFAQNLYPSSLVNEWDGQSLTLDEINSAVISKMIAAGTKDGKNRFTGIMMGDWSAKGDESLDAPGLYGFSAGKQSFGFKTDGTGFIGPSSEGRIQFDGRNALISNSTHTCYINLNPRRIKNYLSEDGNGYIIDNQAWDAINNQSISQYFLYSKTPRKITTFGIGSSDSWSEIQKRYWDQNPDLIWVKPFFEDESHDYFVVDPNYGVVTTGGIFARYGRIGKDCPWIISDYGLTQKNFFGRIFLGNPAKNLSYTSLSMPNPTYTCGENELIEYPQDSGLSGEIPKNFFTASFANEKNIIQTGIRSDGYLYTQFAAIGSWFVNDYEIYTPKNNIFRKTYNKDDMYELDEEGQRTGFLKDYINLNSKDQFLAFNQGRMIINGKDGWMGFYKDGAIDLIADPSKYNMLIGFNNGIISFAKTSEDGPLSQIDGTNGWAYFANKNIILAGKEASMYIGCPVTDNLSEDGAKYITGSIYLSRVRLQGAAREEADTAFVLPNNKTTPYVIDPTIAIEPFNFNITNSPGSGSGKDDGEQIIFNGTLTQMNQLKYEEMKTEEEITTINPQSAFCIWCTDTLPSLEKPDPNVNPLGGIYFGIGDTKKNSFYIQPATSDGTGYLLGNWNINSDKIKALTIQSDQIFMQDAKGYCLVATQYWAYQTLGIPLWERIVEVNNLAAKALRQAQVGISNANKAIGMAVKEVSLMGDGNTEHVTLTLTAKTIDGNSLVTGPNEGIVHVAGIHHSHGLSGDFASGTLTITTLENTDTAYTLKHAHLNSITISNGQLTLKNSDAMNYSETSDTVQTIFNSSGLDVSSSDGQISIKITVAGATASRNFNIADTAFYRKSAVMSAKTVSGGGPNSRVFVTHPDNSTSEYDPNRLSISNDSVIQRNSAGETVASIDLTDYYKSAYDKGWIAAAETFKRNGNTVSGPSSTVGETNSYTASTDAPDQSVYTRTDEVHVPSSGKYTKDGGSATVTFGKSGYYYKTERAYVTGIIKWDK